MKAISPHLNTPSGHTVSQPSVHQRFRERMGPVSRAFAILAAGLMAGQGSVGAADLESSYDWKPLKIGGGGWVVGLDIHPSEKDLIFMRTDVSGAYRWDPAASNWKQVVTASSMPADSVKYGTYRGVESLVSAPSDPNIAYMAYEGQIFRSSNRGDTWTATKFNQAKVKMEPNGEGRQEGERLAVDPHNADIVYFGSIASGLWKTSNAGDRWEKVDAIPSDAPPHGVNTVVFDKASGTLIADGRSKTKTIYVSTNQSGIYATMDAGATWRNLSGDRAADLRNVRDAEIGPDGTYYVVCDNENHATGSVWKHSPAGTWIDITPSSPEGGSQSYSDIAIDPRDANRLVVLRNGGRCFVSNDQGRTWSSHGFRLTSEQVQWHATQENYWLSIGEITFDPTTPDRLWFAEGFGVWEANDLSTEDIEWKSRSAGIEETCGNDIICPPGGKPVGAMWDVGVFRFDDPDTYSAQRAVPYFMSAWALDWCPADPQFIAAVFRNHLGFAPHINESGYSTDGGRTWTIFPAIEKKETPKGLEYGVIAVSANSPDKIAWAPARKKLPYYTADRGATWKQAAFDSEVTRTGFDIHYSPQKPLCADRILPDTFYFYHPDQGIFRSANAGANYRKTTGSPPLKRYNSVLKAVPGHKEHLLFAEGSQGSVVGGLWHSPDGGTTWQQLPFIEQAFNFGLGKAKDPSGYPTIFVAGVANGETGIYRSVDAGSSWDKIGGYPMGIFDWIDAMDGDKETFGKVYLAFTSTGFAYGQERRSP